jgi:hypothetical protein
LRAIGSGSDPVPFGCRGVKFGSMLLAEPLEEICCASLELGGAVVGVGRSGASVREPRSRRGQSVFRSIVHDAIVPPAGLRSASAGSGGRVALPRQYMWALTAVPSALVPVIGVKAALAGSAVPRPQLAAGRLYRPVPALLEVRGVPAGGGRGLTSRALLTGPGLGLLVALGDPFLRSLPRCVAGQPLAHVVS